MPIILCSLLLTVDVLFFSFYARKQLLLSARLSTVCLSVCHTGGSVKNFLRKSCYLFIGSNHLFAAALWDRPVPREGGFGAVISYFYAYCDIFLLLDV